MRRALSIALALAVSGALLAYALRGVDLDELGTRLAGVRFVVVVPFLALFTVHFALKAIRWASILSSLGRYPAIEVAPAMMVGYAANNLLPARIGEVVRAAMLSGRFGLPVGAALVSLVVERLLDLLAVLVIYLAAVIWAGSDHVALRTSLWVAAAGLAVGLGVIGLSLWRGELPRRLMTAAAGRLPAKVVPRVEAQIEPILQALEVLRSPGRVAWMVVNSVMQWSAMAGVIWLSLWAVGAPVPPALAGVVLAVTILAVALPSVPGYVGAIQAAFVFALAPFDVAPEVAFAASAVFLVGGWVPITGTGVLCFVVRRGDLHWRR